MTRQKNTSQRRSSSSSSTSSSEYNLRKNIEKSLCSVSQSSFSQCSTQRKSIYPNVPKRIQRHPSNTQHDTIQTESQIQIFPSKVQSQNHELLQPSISLPAYNANTVLNLNLITKYTSPQKSTSKDIDDSSCSPIQKSLASNINDNVCNSQSKLKRSLSPLCHTSRLCSGSKRIKHFFDDDDDEDAEISEFLDNRCNKKSLSQNSNSAQSFETRIDNEQRKQTVRKPTARKFCANQRKSIRSPTSVLEEPIINISKGSDQIVFTERDTSIEDENVTSIASSTAPTDQRSTSTHHSNDASSSIVADSSILSPVKIRLDILSDSLYPANDNNLLHTPIKHSKSDRSFMNTLWKQTNGNSTSGFSPASTHARRRRYSSESEISCIFGTPCSSLSRTTTDNTTSTPHIVTNKNECETQISSTSYTDMFNQLSSQLNLATSLNDNKLDYNPKEISKRLFYQCNSFSSTNLYPTMHSFIKRQLLHIGRYEIEILRPTHDNKIPTTYVCDTCLKHFNGSFIGFQRHAAKCLYTQPPGKIVFSENHLAIFHIGEAQLNIQQRIYIKSLWRVARLFIDPTKTIDDTKLDRFHYYILCRRDPIISPCQPSLYRLIGYFCKEVNQHTQQSMHNLSCLFILPPFAQHQEYNQLLIAFSYFLIRSNASETLIYSSPARPIDIISLSALRAYWRNTILSSIFDQNRSTTQTMALDALARQTFVHPRDILSTLHSAGLIVSYSKDKSSIYLTKNAPLTISSSYLRFKTKHLLTSINSTNDDDNTTVAADDDNDDKIHDSGIEEIILD